jgi:chemotaxis protein CheD
MSEAGHTTRIHATSIRMGEMAVSMNDGHLRTLLGSCIGLALFDGDLKVGGLAHMVLPQSRGPTDTPGKYVDSAIPSLLRDMQRVAGRSLDLTARIAGGANMFATEVTRTIGVQNIEATERALAELGIPIVGRHCGGEQGRRMSLDTTTGLITIDIVGCAQIQMKNSNSRRRSIHGQARAHR